MGAHKKPFYRIVVADSRFPRDGRCIEEIGYYNPLKNPADIKINLEKAENWQKKGAQPTKIVQSLINNVKKVAV
jgi:small subunit ribosomal protein S16